MQRGGPLTRKTELARGEPIARKTPLDRSRTPMRRTPIARTGLTLKEARQSGLARTTTCTVPDCEESVIARRLCTRHYQRWLKHGDPEASVDVRPARECTCHCCGKPFTVSESLVRLRGAGKHCSVVCRDGCKAERVRARAKTCKQCGERFVPSARASEALNKGKFCSVQCSRQWQSDNIRRQVKLTCAACGAIFERPAAWVRRNSGSVYCSRTCQGDARVRPGSTSSRGSGWGKLSEAIRVRDGRTCVRCSKAEAAETARLSVDHIIPWVLVKHDQEAANHGDNLASLCRRCHGIKTLRTEPRLLRGDWLALTEFYGEERSARAMARVDVRELDPRT